MEKKRKELPLLERLEILDAGAEGKAIARHENKVVFVPFVVPGDIVDIQVTRKKNSYMEGRAVKFHKMSGLRTEARCVHFGLCGGCRWQNMEYGSQLQFKQKQVKDALERIGKLNLPDIRPILPSKEEYYYRNKLEFTFSNRKWFTDKIEQVTEERQRYGLGFHLATLFDRIIDLEECHLQPEPSGKIRQGVRDFALNSAPEFYDIRRRSGFYRNLIIRCTSTGEWMVIMVFGEDRPDDIRKMMEYLAESFPGITSLYYIVNGKNNDDVSDLEAVHWSGAEYIEEAIPLPGPGNESLKFRISPLSFFQTNSRQAARLYKVAWEFAGLSHRELVYDLYSGAGTISCYMAKYASRIVGIEYSVSATMDARNNAALNGIDNAVFFSGDILKVMDDHLVRETGKPDVIITDPPRAGMHEKVTRKILEIGPEKVVYISCNPSTQARDLAMMADQYSIAAVQPVDMFPQTQHVENVVLLVSRKA